jgi:hypothetical protein
MENASTPTNMAIYYNPHNSNEMSCSERETVYATDDQKECVFNPAL